MAREREKEGVSHFTKRKVYAVERLDKSVLQF